MESVAHGRRAGFFRRFAGSLIDGFLLGIVNAIIGGVLGSGAGTGLGFLISLVYFTGFMGSRGGQSIGQMVLGIRVVDIHTGGPIGHPRAFVRWLVSIVSGAVLLLGYLWMLWDRENQCWHDKAAHDVVVVVRD